MVGEELRRFGQKKRGEAAPNFLKRANSELILLVLTRQTSQN